MLLQTLPAAEPATASDIKFTFRRDPRHRVTSRNPGISMQKILSTVFSVFLLFGQAMASEQAEVRQNSGSQEEQKEQQSYSLGYRTGIQMKKYSVDLDPDTFIKAFRAGFAGDKAAMTDQEMRDAMRLFRVEMQAKQAERSKGLAAKNQQEGAEPATASDIRFAFKLNPRLSGGTYGGERWVSPPTYTGVSAQSTVEVRAGVFDMAGMPMKINPKWIPDNPALVSVSPGDGTRVKITVQGAGESRLKVTANGASRELVIKARSVNDALQMEISQ
jgi:Domain amino terminal to FKBP-type peptidyl-prolyl isomerase